MMPSISALWLARSTLPAVREAWSFFSKAVAATRICCRESHWCPLLSSPASSAVCKPSHSIVI